MPTPPTAEKPASGRGAGKAVRISKAGIAAALQINRNTVGSYLALPDAPRPRRRKYDLEEVRAFISGKTTKGILDNERKGKTLDLRETLLTTRAEEAAFDLGVKRGKYVERELVEPAIVAFNGQLTADLQALFEQELPAKYAGKSQIECQLLNAEAIDRVLKRLRAGQASLVGKGAA